MKPAQFDISRQKHRDKRQASAGFWWWTDPGWYELLWPNGWTVVLASSRKITASGLAGRVAANAVMPYPPGIPMLMSGESFGDADSPQISYLKSMEERERHFPGFAGVIEGAELIDGAYQVLCIKP